MLSIIVSSYQQSYFEKFSENVNATIGDDFIYEIIQQWNPGVMGICEAYNKGAEKALYENLLFIHEDVLFETKDWGEILIEHLSNISTGCIGVAGNAIKSHFPIAWWDIKETEYLHLNQRMNDKKLIEKRLLTNNNEVVLLDGVFIGLRKNVWTEIKFNEDLLKGFHAYDIDFSARVSKKYKNYVNNDILITHFSEGSPNKEWFIELTKVYTYTKEKMITDVSIRTNKLSKIELYFRYLRNFKFTKRSKIILFFKFYNPLEYTIKENQRILKMFYYYTFK
ncbi:glycosyltransferase family protein [Empedobacter falsenii]